MLPFSKVFALLGLLALSSPADSQVPSWPVNPAANGDAPVTMIYDKFEDRTKVSIEIKPAKVSDSTGNSTFYRIPLSVEFVCPGRKIKCGPANILVIYEAGWQSVARCDSLDVIFMADDVRYNRGECRWLGSSVTFYLAPSDLTSFGNAKRLEAKIGVLIFTFDEDGLRGLRMLSEHIEIPAPPVKPGQGRK